MPVVRAPYLLRTALSYVFVLRPPGLSVNVSGLLLPLLMSGLIYGPDMIHLALPIVVFFFVF